MNEQQVIDLVTDAFKIGLMLSFPIMLSTLAIGITVSVIQSVTSIQEQTMVFVPKIIAVFVAVLVFFSWMLTKVMNFTVDLFSSIPNMTQ